jgi:putative addiction module component (TIGR02574 family)
MHGVKEIISEVTTLPVEERAEVADSILRSLNAPDPDIDRQWIEVAERRLDDLRSGRVKAIPGEQVFTRLRERFR